jgi:flagellar M-ring protein FliF
MGESFQKIRTQLNEFWQHRTAAQRIKIIISAAIIIVCAAILALYASKPDMAPLYSDLDIKDAAAIAEKLDQMKVKWKTGSVDTEILVPRKEINRLRMQLASEGLPQNRFSLIDAFDGAGLGTTDMERRERIRLSQEYAISQAIETIDGVEYCHVNLYIPQDSIFALNKQENQSSAGIIIKTLPGRSLSDRQIDGIVQFVSRSVKGLTKENISIIDQTGSELSVNTDSEQGRLLTQMEMERSVQERLQGSIREFLETVYGKNNVDVRVNLRLDFDSQVTNIVRFEPPIPGETDGLVASMEQLEEHAVNGGRGGVPGTDSNDQQVITYAETESQQSKYDKVSSVINYQLNQIKEEIVTAKGRVEDLSVAVLINSSSIGRELNEQDRDDLADIVAAAAGIEPGLVQIRSMPFDNSLTNQIAEGFERRQRFERMRLLTYIGLFVAIAIITAILIILRRKRPEAKIRSMLKTMQATGQDVEEINTSPAENATRKQVEKFIAKKPEMAAQLVKTWIREE